MEVYDHDKPMLRWGNRRMPHQLIRFIDLVNQVGSFGA